jgi:hypothetical protein
MDFNVTGLAGPRSGAFAYGPLPPSFSFILDPLIQHSFSLFIQPNTNRTFSYACDIGSTTAVNCTATGGVRKISGPSSTIVTPGAITLSFTGSIASEQFGSVSIVADSSSLLTYTPLGAMITGLTTLSTGFSTSLRPDSSDELTTAQPTASVGTMASLTGVSPTTSVTTALSTSISVGPSTEAETPSIAASSTSAKTGGAGVAKMGVREAFGAVMAVFLALNVI